MFEISRRRDVEVINEILPFCTFSREDLAEGYAIDLEKRLLRDPESVQVLVAKIETGEIVGFTVSVNPAFYYPHVFLNQTWIKAGTSMELGKLLLSQVIMWSIGLGKKCIRGETQRSTDAIMRRFGFKNLSSTIELDIEDLHIPLNHVIRKIHDG